jgi:hypothetical protein
MKRLLIHASLLFVVVIGFTGCYKDVISPEADPDGPPQAVSFKDDLAPLLNKSCALTGCHVSGGHKPYMNTNISYQEIVNGGFVNTLIPKESILIKYLNGEMAQYMPSKADRQKVYDWVRNGAPNN